MPYDPTQRPGSPTSFGNWQGLYDTPAELPNVAGSSTQVGVPNLQQFDIAGVTGGATPGLYVCTSPTYGAATWLPLSTSGGASATVDSGEYTPTFSGFTALVLGVVAATPWRWLRIGNTIAVWGEAVATLGPGPGLANFEASLPFVPTVGTSMNTVANMTAVPPTGAAEAPVSPYSTATTVGFSLNVSGVYFSARVMTSFSFITG